MDMSSGLLLRRARRGVFGLGDLAQHRDLVVRDVTRHIADPFRIWSQLFAPDAGLALDVSATIERDAALTPVAHRALHCAKALCESRDATGQPDGLVERAFHAVSITKHVCLVNTPCVRWQTQRVMQ